MDKLQETGFYIKLMAGSGLGIILSEFLGGWDILLQTLVYLTILDFVTGVLASIYYKQLSSKIGSRGIVKKMGIYIIVATAFILDGFLGMEVLRSSAIGFYIVTEGVSILENWGKMNLPLPKAVKDVLVQLHEKKEELKGMS